MDRIARSLAPPSHPFPLRRILVLGDLSAGAENAAWRAGLLAAEHGASVHLVQVGSWTGTTGMPQRRLQALAWHLQERLDVPVQAQAAGRGSRRELADAAAQADLIVLRAPRWFGFMAGRWVRPDHPLRVLHRFERPTLLVRRPAAVPYQRVLAGIHESRHAAVGIATASGMAGGPHVDLLRYGVLDPRAMDGIGSRDELEADSLARHLQGRVHDLARELGAGRMKEAPTILFTASADALLEQEYAFFPELVVHSHPALLTPGLLVRTMADTLVLPATEPTPDAVSAEGVSLMPLQQGLEVAR